MSTLKTNTIQAATGSTVNVASGHVLNASGHVIQMTSHVNNAGLTLSSSATAKFMDLVDYRLWWRD